MYIYSLCKVWRSLLCGSYFLTQIKKQNWKSTFFYVPRPTDELPCTPPSESQRALYSVLVSRIQEEPLKGMVGPDCVTGSNLPSHSDVHISCLTGLKIQVRFQRAEVFFLADSRLLVRLPWIKGPSHHLPGKMFTLLSQE